MRLPRLKWLNVSHCAGLVEMSELPSSIAVLIANFCCSLESFGNISNCKWLWIVSLTGKNKLDPLRADTLIHYMLQGNAIRDHFISVALQYHFPYGFVDKLLKGKQFRVHLPDDWYNEFCGLLICITSTSCPTINITIKKEDPPLDLSQEYDEAAELIFRGKLSYIGYISFTSLRHTTLLTSSYNVISFTKDIDSDGKSIYGKIDLVPRKSKSDEVQTTDCSEFWEKKFQDARFSTFAIQQCDSKSSIEIVWKPNHN